MMIEYLLGLLILIFPSAVAWGFIEVLDSRRVLTVAEKLPLAYMLGLGTVAWGMLVLQLLGKPFGPSWLLTLLLSVGIPSILNYGRRKKYPQIIVQPRKLRLAERRSKVDILLLVGIGLEIGFAFTRALLLPMEDFDAVTNWGLKAKAIYLAKGIPLSFLTNREYATVHADYPLLLPLVESYVYFLLGHVNDFAVKWIFPLSLTACVIAFYASLRRLTLDRTACLAFAFTLVSIPQLVFNATNAYADILIATYFGMGFFYLFLWIRQRNDLFLGLSALLTGMAGLTKSEGMILCLVNLFVLVWSANRERSLDRLQAWRQVLLYAGVLATVLLPWLVFRFSMKAQNDYLHELRVEHVLQWETVMRMRAIFYHYQGQLFNFKSWNLLWLAALGLFFFRFKRIFRSDQRYIFLATALTLSIYTSIYFITFNDVTWHLKTSASRLLVHFVPLVVFGFACAYLDRADTE